MIPESRLGPFGTSLPLHVRVRLELENAIKTGAYKEGERLPSERELCNTYQVSSSPVRRALLELERDGLICRHVGLGTFVARRCRSARLLVMTAGYQQAVWRERGGWFVGELMGGVSQVAWEHQAIVSFTDLAPSTPLHAALHAVAAQKDFDGVILRTAHDVDERALECLEEKRFPYVVVLRRIPGREMSCVTVDFERGAYEATGHLAALGYRRIGAVLGPRALSVFVERWQGYLQALREAKLPLDPSLVHETADYGERDGYTATIALMTGPVLPEALFLSHIELAPGVYSALHELGLRIPDDVALAGVDLGPWSARLVPPLTAVGARLYDVGVESARSLLRMIESGGQARQPIVVPTRLTIRASSGGREMAHSQAEPTQSADVAELDLR
ncbi:MAG: GntR family transcriptional regulator [Dehalococcoidales bacterium]|nr:GntR family transcriptional regulator [Dehalococcoidales bacterium]